LSPKSRANNSITWYASHALSKRKYDWTERPDAPRYDHRACHAAHDGKKRTKLHRLIKNLITKATTADDVLYTNGNIIKEGTSGLSAIQEIINRLEGKPSQLQAGLDAERRRGFGTKCGCRFVLVELVTQLNELIKCADGSKRAKLHRLIKNLITKATTADDVLDKDGNVIKEGTGDLSAIQEILIGETRPPQTR
jgi:hypothetical protein